MRVWVLFVFPHFFCDWIDFFFRKKKHPRVSVWIHEWIGQTHDYGRTIYYVVMMMVMTVTVSVSVCSAQHIQTNYIVRRLFVFSIFLFLSRFGCVSACVRARVCVCLCVCECCFYWCTHRFIVQHIRHRMKAERILTIVQKDGRMNIHSLWQ